MADNLSVVPTVAGSNPVTPELIPQFRTSSLTLASTSNQPLTISVLVNHNEKPEKICGLNFKT